MYINHNQMATNVANTLTSHYNNLSTSTQRLSSGLRVNSAADDAAGLAIRELMRADIAALNQGVRNANDAISLIQTADGAMGIIDEKLIRMKELAEQAATGTYDSTQRLMIESEYQAMASEITRIANATDFNGIKLLDGSLQGTHDGSKMDSEGALKVHFGPGNDSAEDYYYIEIEEMTAQALGVGNASTWQDVQNRGATAFRQALTDQIKNDTTLSDADRAKLLASVDEAVEQYQNAFTNATDYKQAFKMWNAAEGEGFMPEGKNWPGNSSLMTDYLTAAAGAATTAGGPTAKTDITTKITAAINDSLPQSNEVKWETDAAKFAIQQTEMWNKLEADVKATAKEAGFTDAEISELLTGKDGKGGLKGEWKEAMKTPPTDADAATVQTNGDALLSAAKGNLTGTGALAAPLKPGGLASFMTADSDAWDGTATNGDVIELRNQGYAEYANATDKSQVKVGPTDVDAIIGNIQAAIDAAKIDTTASGDLTDDTTPSTAYKENQKLMDAIKTAAMEAGFDEDEADALVDKLSGTAGIALLAANAPADAEVKAFAADNEIAAGDDSAKEWGYYKENLKLAVGSALNDRVVPDSYKAFSLKTDGTNDLNGKETMGVAVAIRNQGRAAAKANDQLDQFWNGLNDAEKQKLQYAWGQAASYNLANADAERNMQLFGIDASTFSFNTALGLGSDGFDVNLKDNEMLKNAIKAGNDKISSMDFAGYTIQTQEDAQMALNALNDAITQKDKVRAHLGALQNRLENTVSNLTVQSENLQAAESRISDVDVATEMTNFTRNQILTQSAVAMLGQANSMPQMAMQLIH